MPNMSAVGLSGQAWFLPEPTASAISFTHALRVLQTGGGLPKAPVGPMTSFYPVLRPDTPRVVVLDQDESELCHTQIIGSTPDGYGNPQGTICTVQASATDLSQLHSVVTINEDHSYKMFMEGIKPFFSSTREEWFDPTQYPHVDPASFLVPKD
jgi:hypothetical protein